MPGLIVLSVMIMCHLFEYDLVQVLHARFPKVACASTNPKSWHLSVSWDEENKPPILKKDHPGSRFLIADQNSRSRAVYSQPPSTTSIDRPSHTQDGAIQHPVILVVTGSSGVLLCQLPAPLLNYPQITLPARHHSQWPVRGGCEPPTWARH